MKDTSTHQQTHGVYLRIGFKSGDHIRVLVANYVVTESKGILGDSDYHFKWANTVAAEPTLKFLDLKSVDYIIVDGYREKAPTKTVTPTTTEPADPQGTLPSTTDKGVVD